VKKSAREKLRAYLFVELIPLPAGEWPADDENLFALGLDSIGTMRLVAFIEEELGVRLAEESIVPETLGSVGSLLRAMGESAGAG